MKRLAIKERKKASGQDTIDSELGVDDGSTDNHYEAVDAMSEEEVTTLRYIFSQASNSQSFGRITTLIHEAAHRLPLKKGENTELRSFRCEIQSFNECKNK